MLSPVAPSPRLTVRLGLQQPATSHDSGRNKSTVPGFYRWYSQTVEPQIAARENSHFDVYLKSLSDYRQKSRATFKKADEALQIMNKMESDTDSIASKTAQLHTTCNDLMKEQHALTARVEKMQAPLKYFNELQELGPLLGLALTADGASAPALPGRELSPESTEFADVLLRLDDSVEFLSKNPQVFSDSGVYLKRMHQLQKRALTLVKNRIVSILQSATHSAHTAKVPTHSFYYNNCFNLPTGTRPHGQGQGAAGRGRRRGRGRCR